MEIKVRLFATLREGRGKQMMMNFENSVCPADILKELGIAQEEVAILYINGRDADFDQPLKDQDTVSIFPPVGGG